MFDGPWSRQPVVAVQGLNALLIFLSNVMFNLKYSRYILWNINKMVDNGITSKNIKEFRNSQIIFKIFFYK